MYIFAIHLITFTFDNLTNISKSPSGSENTSVSTNIASDASIPSASLDTTLPSSTKRLPLSTAKSLSFTTLSALKHMLSSSPHSSAIERNIPSSSISRSVDCTLSLNSVLPSLKPIPYCSLDTCCDNILNLPPLALSS